MATKRTTKKKNAKSAKPTARVGKERNIDLRFILPPDLPIHYVDNIQITHTPSEFVISFMQSRPPLLRSEKEWEKVTSIESVCVSRIILNPAKMQTFVQALTANFKKYFASYIQPELANEAKTRENTATGNGANANKPV